MTACQFFLDKKKFSLRKTEYEFENVDILEYIGKVTSESQKNNFDEVLSKSISIEDNNLIETDKNKERETVTNENETKENEIVENDIKILAYLEKGPILGKKFYREFFSSADVSDEESPSEVTQKDDFAIIKYKSYASN